MDICLTVITERRRETTSSVTTTRGTWITIEETAETEAAAKATMNAEAEARDLIVRT